MSSKLMALLGVAAMLSLAIGKSWASPVGVGDGLLPVVGTTTGADPMFSFSFTGGDMSGTGLLYTDDLGADAYGVTLVLSGSVVSLDYSGPVALIGSYNVRTFYSPSGHFQVDNLVYYPSTPGNLLDTWGLLLKPTGLNPNNVTEINIWGNGGVANYTYDEWRPDVGFTSRSDAVTFSLTEVSSVPLPASVGVGFGMLGGFGALFGMRKRLSRRARIA